MNTVITGLRTLFGSNTSSKNDSYLTWARTEYKNDWQFAYQHMLDHNGAAPTRKDLHPWNDGALKTQNTNLTGWV
jgi:hypothetical protein